MLRTIIVWVLGVLVTFFFFMSVGAAFFVAGGTLINTLIVSWCRSILAISGVKIAVKGAERLPKKGPFIFVANHKGAYDIPALQAGIPHEFKWIAKKSLFNVPLVGWSMRFAGYIPIDRENATAAYKSMELAAERIKNGTSVLVFPEGTRNSTDEPLLPFKRGSFLLAVKSRVPIVPVAIDGTRDIMKKGGYAIHPADVYISIGDPIPTTGLSEKELRETARLAIEELIRKGLKA